MKRTSLSLIAIVSLSLAACNGSVTDEGSNSSASNTDTSTDSSIRETHNVSYQGMVQKAGMSIYMEGTHRLELENGRFVLLESDDFDLDRYVQKKVAVLGSARPTTEGQSTILRVEQITLLQDENDASSDSSSSSSDESSSSSEESSSSSSEERAAVQTSSSVKPVAQAVSSAAPVASSVATSSSSSSAAATVSAPVGDDIAAKTAIMTKANLAEGNWTQKYCSTHLGFCFPVHKNWWFKSFGTTSSSLWHVEIGTEEMTELGQGPIIVNLVSGSLASAGATDGNVSAEGEYVVGYAAFNDKSHFEVSAPKALDAAVRYIISHIQQGQ